MGLESNKGVKIRIRSGTEVELESQSESGITMNTIGYQKSSVAERKAEDKNRADSSKKKVINMFTTKDLGEWRFRVSQGFSSPYILIRPEGLRAPEAGRTPPPLPPPPTGLNRDRPRIYPEIKLSYDIAAERNQSN
ncbi:hypothetical protein EVAR_868_1 [Eumeta japonica]|uniref:Uncharacterized protein n=1 Tax=Eumeta variegata TaxID=151549 RepID=A0A4C1SEG0_EUMVA|nr:hypothetical protein EVAR_868_1 [Eumeta japonica]